MIFEFLISCSMPPHNDMEDVQDYLVDVLNQAIDLSEVDFDDSIIQIHSQRPVTEAPAYRGNLLVGFSPEIAG